MGEITTTLEDIEKIGGHDNIPEELLKYLNKTKPEPLKFTTILEVTTLDYTLWCLQSILERYRSIFSNLSADIAERVLPVYEKEFPDDDRPRKAIQAARDFANGKIAENDINSANEAARAANEADSMDGVESSAAWAAAWAARGDSVWQTARAARIASGVNKNIEEESQIKLFLKYFEKHYNLIK